MDQLGEERKVFWYAPNYMMVLGLEFYVDPLCFGSNMHVRCVALCIRFRKCPRSSKLEFGAKSYSRFSVERSMTGLCDLRVRSTPASPVRESGQCFLHVQKRSDTRGVRSMMT